MLFSPSIFAAPRTHDVGGPGVPSSNYTLAPGPPRQGPGLPRISHGITVSFRVRSL
jgi:hypothetical protein